MARILSLIAIPVVLAILGGLIQATLSRNTVSRDYVQMAITILTADKTKTPPELRSWAVDLLNKNSPIKFSDVVVAQLKAGNIEFPGAIAAALSNQGTAGGMSVSSDGRFIAAAQDKAIYVWALSSGNLVKTLEGHTASVTSVAFSPNARNISFWKPR